MEILVKIITTLAFMGAVFFLLGGLIQSANSIINKKTYDATMHFILGSICCGVLFFEYAA